ncbi:unnamed protein product [Colias eurytheme]|nr:unnamed protein product [Colias eurytheme]
MNNYDPHNITFAGNLSRLFPKAGAPRLVFRARSDIVGALHRARRLSPASGAVCSGRVDWGWRVGGKLCRCARNALASVARRRGPAHGRYLPRATHGHAARLVHVQAASCCRLSASGRVPACCASVCTCATLQC